MEKLSRPFAIAAWTVAILLCAGFLPAAFLKLSSSPIMLAEFASFGYPVWFMYITGVLELAGCVAVLIPRFARFGAALLACIMLGAIVSHVTHGQADKIAPPVVLLVLSLAELYLRGGFRATPALSEA